MTRFYEHRGLAKHFKEASAAGRKNVRVRRRGYAGTTSPLHVSNHYPKTLLNWFRWWTGIYMAGNDLTTARAKAIQACKEMWWERVAALDKQINVA